MRQVPSSPISTGKTTRRECRARLIVRRTAKRASFLFFRSPLPRIGAWMVAGLALLIVCEPAAAQTTPTVIELVTNRDRPQMGDPGTDGNPLNTRITYFTTGGHANGYTLRAIDVRSRGNNRFTVRVFSVGADGLPANHLYRLSEPPDYGGSSINFKRHLADDVYLSPNTEYAIWVSPPGGTCCGTTYITVQDNGEDPGAADGWSIGDRAHRSFSGGATWISATWKLGIAVRGWANPTMPTPVTFTAATTGDVTTVAEDGGININVTPSVAPSVRVQVEWAITPDGANPIGRTGPTGFGLGSSGNWPDLKSNTSSADGGGAGRGKGGLLTFLPDSTKAQTIRIEPFDDLIDDDDETFTITLRNPDPFVTLPGASDIPVITITDDDDDTTIEGDLGLSTLSRSREQAADSEVGSNVEAGQLFRVGNAVGEFERGFRLTSVGMRVNSGATPALSIWTAGSDLRPSTKLYDLTAPATLATGGAVNFWTAPADADLDADTRYAVVATASATSSLAVAAHVGGPEAAGPISKALPGWSMRNRHWQRTGGGNWVEGANMLMVGMYGVGSTPDYSVLPTGIAVTGSPSLQTRGAADIVWTVETPRGEITQSQVRWRETETEDWSAPVMISDAELMHTATDLDEETMYEAQVRVWNSAGFSDWSEPSAAFSPQTTAPDAPRNVGVTPIDGALLVTWDPPVNPDITISEYQVGVASDFNGRTEANWNAQTHTTTLDGPRNCGPTCHLMDDDNWMVNDRSYGVRVRTRYRPEPTASDTSSSDVGLFDGDFTPMAGLTYPSDLTATPGQGRTTLNLAWTADDRISRLAGRYRVAGATEWSALTDLATSPHAITGLEPGTDYEIQVMVGFLTVAGDQTSVRAFPDWNPAAGNQAAASTKAEPEPEPPPGPPPGPSRSLTLNETSVTVAEGASASWTVVLDSEPGKTVIVTPSSADPDVATTSPKTLVFTPENWDTPQTVTVTGADDGVAGGEDRTTTVTHAARGAEYSFLLRNPVEVTVTDGSATVSAEADELPTEVGLSQNYPNPFNPRTTIEYALPQAGDVRLVAYDMLGREVAVLHDGPQTAGRHAARFHAGHLPNGSYVYRLTAGGKTLARTMALAK